MKNFKTYTLKYILVSCKVAFIVPVHQSYVRVTLLDADPKLYISLPSFCLLNKATLIAEVLALPKEPKSYEATTTISAENCSAYEINNS